jgi:hypothetical protein
MIAPTISHDRQAETPEAKARWFQSLSLSERMDLLCFFTDLALTNNPKILEQKDAQPVAGRIRVLSRDDLIASKGTAAREVDLEDVRLLGLSDK